MKEWDAEPFRNVEPAISTACDLGHVPRLSGRTALARSSLIAKDAAAKAKTEASADV